MPDNLTGQNISDTYQRLLQIQGGVLTDGTGSAVIVPSASYAVSASHEIILETSSSRAETAGTLSGLTTTVAELNHLDGISGANGTHVKAMNQSVATSNGPTFIAVTLSGTGITGPNINLPAGATSANPHIAIRSEDTPPSIYLGDVDEDIITFVSQGADAVASITQDGVFSGIATTATNVTATANNTTDETTYLTFIDGVSGAQGIETDTGLTYNPSTNGVTLGQITASSNISASGGVTASGIFLPAQGRVKFADDQFITGQNNSLTIDGDDTVKIKADNFVEYMDGNNDTKLYIDSNVGHVTASGNISSSGRVIANHLYINPEAATQTALVTAVNQGGYSLFVASSSKTTKALIYSDSEHAELQIRGNSGYSAQIVFNEDGSSRYILGSVGSDDSFQIRNSSYMTGGDQLFKIEHDGSGMTLGHDSGFHVTASGNISSSGTIISNIITPTTITNVSTTHVTASGNVSASGYISGSDGGAGYVVRPNLYWYANCDAVTITPSSLGSSDNGDLPSTNTATASFAETINSNSSVFSLSNDALTISRAGIYKMTYNITLEIKSQSNRTEGIAGIVRTSGTPAVIDGSVVHTYNRFVADGTKISRDTGTATVLINVAANDVFKILFARYRQTGASTTRLQTLTRGTSWVVEAVT